MCWRERREPSERDFALVDMATRLMGFAIERHEAEELILQQQMKLIASSRLVALGEMAAGVDHEINNPLTLIHGYAQKLEFLASRGQLDVEALRDHAKTIKIGAQRIHKIVKGLRAIAREGENDPFRETALQTILDETLELCRERILQNGIQLTVDPLPEGLTLECRAVQISQVILNLLNNSFDALQSVDVRWIRLSVDANPESITLAVTDSGPGVPVEIREKIMMPFFTTKKATDGTGLGLSISRSIIAAHQGDFYLDATCSETRFVCVLPRHQPKPAS
jgi:C4-dicarboxylate-specific signal transduction histidine kinase